MGKRLIGCWCMLLRTELTGMSASVPLLCCQHLSILFSPQRTVAQSGGQELSGWCLRQKWKEIKCQQMTEHLNLFWNISQWPLFPIKWHLPVACQAKVRSCSSPLSSSVPKWIHRPDSSRPLLIWSECVRRRWTAVRWSLADWWWYWNVLSVEGRN